jgi:hypothetical protein
LSDGKNDMIGAWNESRLIGHPLSIYYDYKYNGLWRQEDAELMAKYNSDKHPVTGESKTAHNFKAGQIRPLDMNEDYQIDANNDRVVIGNRRPNWFGGLNNILSYKGVELQFQIFGRMKYWTEGAQVGMGARNMIRKVSYYTDNNQNAYYQRPERTSDGSDRDQYNTITRYVKGDFINVRNISLGYVFPRSMIQKWGSMQSLRIYAQIMNPFSIYSACDFKNMDVNSSFWNRNYVFGLNIGF